MNYFLLYTLNTLAILIELVYDSSRFILVNSIVLSIIAYEYIMMIDWNEVKGVLKDTKNTIENAFTYKSEVT